MTSLDHELECMCCRCRTQQLGRWFDELGKQTEPGKWQVFLTCTYATTSYPWRRGFPSAVAGKPSEDFGRHCFEFFISQLSAQLGELVDYVVGDEYGWLNGRFHQHALLAARGLGEYPRHEIESWFLKRAGFARALPSERGSAFYIARFVGRDIDRAHWDVQIGDQEAAPNKRSNTGRCVVVQSANLSQALFHHTLPRRKR
jgi:hypothetical protein